MLRIKKLNKLSMRLLTWIWTILILLILRLLISPRLFLLMPLMICKPTLGTSIKESMINFPKHDCSCLMLELIIHFIFNISIKPKLEILNSHKKSFLSLNFLPISMFPTLNFLMSNISYFFNIK